MIKSKHDCVICLEEINKLKECILLECNHCYHINCFSKYILYNLKKIKTSRCIQCPTCRKYIRKDDIVKKFFINLNDLRNKTYKINKEKDTLQNKLFFMNLKKCLWFKKNPTLLLKEEKTIEKINELNNQLIRENNKCKILKKTYYSLIDNIEYNNLIF